MSEYIPLIGGHVSSSGGLKSAIANAQRIGANCIQFFGASPRQWHASLPAQQEIDAYRAALKESDVKAVFLHAAYLVNLASPSQESMEKSIKNLAIHLRIAESIGAKGLIFHVGSGKEMPKEKAIEQTARAMTEVLRLAPGTAFLVMENAAGGGQKIGARLEEFRTIMDLVRASDNTSNEKNHSRIKVCFDTAHAFEAGLIDEYTPKKIKETFDHFDETIGLENLVALHINDSKTPANSNHDHHENLGHGHISLDGFRALAKEKRLHHAAWILEVPGFDNSGPDKENVDILKSCFKF